MIGLLQRVSEARVEIAGETVGAIGAGLVVLVCAEPADDERAVERLLARLLDYRVFADEAGKMNLSLRSVGGGLLLVPQFTLAADTRSGTRPGFSTAAPPALARSLFEYLLSRARASHPVVEAGRFGADMKVHLVNDGPVTFWLQTPSPSVGG
jgi:D-tyrosyl-tRNA(Tyr) deacylase